MIWFELDEKKLGGKSVIYRTYTIQSSYVKENINTYNFGYDVYDKDLNPLIRFSTFDKAVQCVDKLMK